MTKNVCEQPIIMVNLYIILLTLAMSYSLSWARSGTYKIQNISRTSYGDYDVQELDPFEGKTDDPRNSHYLDYLASYIRLVGKESIGSSEKINYQSRFSVKKRELTDDELRKYRETLEAIAVYLQHHKYFDFDHRYESRDTKHKKKTLAKVAAFVHRFPVPPLRKLTQHVKDACEKSYHECITHIGRYATHSHIYQFLIKDVRDRKINKEKAPFRFLETAKTDDKFNYQPFSNMLQLFQFRTTASYYMCWYTLEKLKIFERFPRSCNYWWEKDYRGTNTEDFACALYSFCPDVCCSHVPGGTLYLTDADKCKKSKENLCYGIVDGSCRVDSLHNRNFRAMIMNRINITCRCHDQRIGYRWSNHFDLCVDADECYEGNHECEEQEACLNTLGSYTCTCGRGFELAKDGTHECIRRKDMDWSEVEEEERPAPPLSKWKKAEMVIDKVYAFIMSKVTQVKGEATPSVQANLIPYGIAFGYLLVQWNTSG